MFSHRCVALRRKMWHTKHVRRYVIFGGDRTKGKAMLLVLLEMLVHGWDEGAATLNRACQEGYKGMDICCCCFLSASLSSAIIVSAANCFSVPFRCPSIFRKEDS